jgi:hypothetical protein
LIWGSGVAHVGPQWTYAAAALIALAVLALGYRFSINFAAEANIDAAPLNPLHDFPVSPEHEDGPITVTIEYSIPAENREQFRALMQEVQATVRRNGAFHCRLDESLENPGKFRLEYVVSTWVEHLRQNMRMTIDETEVYNAAWDLHSGDSEPTVRHFMATQRSVHLHGYGFCGRTFGDASGLSKPKLAAATSGPGG